MHVNHNLPPVGVKILVKVDENFIPAIRKYWITNKDSSYDVETLEEPIETIRIPRGSSVWMYY